MLIAAGKKVGAAYWKWLEDRNLLGFVDQAKRLLENYGDRFCLPVDLAYEEDGKRVEVDVDHLDLPEAMFLDIGSKTIEQFAGLIGEAKTIFANGPAGVYENPLFEQGTKNIMEAIAQSEGYSVLGGGDTVTAASKYVNLKDIGYVCTAGGAMVRFLSGKTLPLIEAMKG